MGKVIGVILDVDGTLVDSNHQHAMAWYDAFRSVGRDIAYERIRRLIGKGSDKLLKELVGDSPDSPTGKAISDACQRIFKEKYLSQVRPFAKAADLVAALRHRGKKLAVASSARREDLEALLAIAGVPELIEQSTTSNEADRSKPDPEIVTAAREKLGTSVDHTVMLGDTPYDVESGLRAEIGVVALLCGGWNETDLRGAVAIYRNPADLLFRLTESPFA